MVVLKFRRMLTKFGNSIVASIPAEYVKNYDLKAGEEYQFTIDTEQRQPVEPAPAQPPDSSGHEETHIPELDEALGDPAEEEQADSEEDPQ